MICCKLGLTVTPGRPAHDPCSTWHRNGNCNKTGSAYTFSRRLWLNAENHPGDAMSGSGCPVSCLDACRPPGLAGNLLSAVITPMQSGFLCFCRSIYPCRKTSQAATSSRVRILLSASATFLPFPLPLCWRRKALHSCVMHESLKPVESAKDTTGTIHAEWKFLRLITSRRNLAWISYI